MNDEIEKIIETAKEMMEDTLSHFDAELSKIRAGKANPAMLDGINVEYYGNLTPLNQVCNINTPDARTLSIQPWEKIMVAPIEKAIATANIGLNPQNNGELVIINVPVLTEERRKELVKRTKVVGEDAKISLRNARKEANDEVKKLQKEGMSEDLANEAEEKIQKNTDKYTQGIDSDLVRKEKDIMTV